MVVARDDRFGEGFWQGPAKSVTRSVPWAGMTGFQTIVLGPPAVGRPPILLIMGGRWDSTYRNDVWRSRDGGGTWEEASSNEEGQAVDGGRIRSKWAGREGFAAAGGWKAGDGLLKSMVYVVGGLGARSPPFADVWASDDLGKTFVRMCSDAPFGSRVSSGLAVCPGKPHRLVLVGGGWNDDIARWDCWLSMDAGESWTEIQTPDNSMQRRMPVLSFTRLGTLLVLGGHNRRTSYDDAWVARLQWTKKLASWQRFQVLIGEDPLEEMQDSDRPWFLNHFSAVDLRGGVFIGFGSAGVVATGELPACVFVGKTPVEPWPEEQLRISVSLNPARLPFSCSLQSYISSNLRLLIPADALRLYVFTERAIWVTGGSASDTHAEIRRQHRILRSCGLQLQVANNFPVEIWDRALSFVLPVL